MSKEIKASFILFPRKEIENIHKVSETIKYIVEKTCHEEEIKIISKELTSSCLYLFLSIKEEKYYDQNHDLINNLKRKTSERILHFFYETNGEVYQNNFWKDEHILTINDTKTNNLNNNENEQQKKCLVTGGLGFIGSNLVDKLIKANYKVVVVDNATTGKKEYLNEKAVFYKVDICDKESLREIFLKEKPEYIFHLAAQIDVRKSVENPALDNKINVVGATNVLELAKEINIKKFIFTSSGGAIYSENDIMANEKSHPEPISPYGINKLTFEKYLYYFYKVYKLNYIAIRYSNVYGPRQYKGGGAGVVSLFINKAVNKEKLIINGDGLQTRDLIYVDDAVNALILALENDFIGEINVSSSKETSLLNIVKYIEEAIGYKLDVEFSEAKLGEVRRSILDYSKAKIILNWEPKINLIEGIKKTIDWEKNKTFFS